MAETQGEKTKQILLPFLVTAGFPLLGALILFMYFIWALESETLPTGTLAKIHQGMPESELVELVGPPAEVSTNQSGSVTWIYKRSFRWNFVKITLKNDQVIRVIQE